MTNDDDYHVSPEFYAAISAASIKNTSVLFQDRCRVLAAAIALCRSEFDGSMLTELYEALYIPVALDSKQAENRRRSIFPRPERALYDRGGALDVQGTRTAQHSYFTSASRVFLNPLGIPLHKVPPHRKGSHDKVFLYRSRLHQPFSALAVSPHLRAKIQAVLG